VRGDDVYYHFKSSSNFLYPPIGAFILMNKSCAIYFRASFCSTEVAQVVSELGNRPKEGTENKEKGIHNRK
jgi:hypothetical protein